MEALETEHHISEDLELWISNTLKYMHSAMKLQNLSDSSRLHLLESPMVHIELLLAIFGDFFPRWARDPRKLSSTSGFFVISSKAFNVKFTKFGTAIGHNQVCVLCITCTS